MHLLDEFKGVFGDYRQPVCQFEQRLLVVHGEYSRLHVCMHWSSEQWPHI